MKNLDHALALCLTVAVLIAGFALGWSVRGASNALRAERTTEIQMESVKIDMVPGKVLRLDLPDGTEVFYDRRR